MLSEEQKNPNINFELLANEIVGFAVRKGHSFASLFQMSNTFELWKDQSHLIRHSVGTSIEP